MRTRAEQAKADLIERTAQTTAQRLDRKRAADVERFVRLFYANVPPDDILEDSPENLFSAAMTLWNFGLQRTPGSAKVRVYNPRLDEHGWRSPHTVVEIVNDDMPFLVDSVTAELNRRELTVHLVIHPILRVKRDAKGQLTGTGEASAPAESYMQIRISEQSAPETLEQIKQGLESILAEVRVTVRDWPAMRTRIEQITKELGQSKLPLPKDEVSEAHDFLAWVAEDHFTFLGYREYDFSGEGDNATLTVKAGSGLGILSDDNYSVFDRQKNFERMPAEVRAFMRQPQLLAIMKSNKRATVHRPVHMDTIGIKRFDAEGNPAGEQLFIGLFTSITYNKSPREIPLLRRKVERVIARAGFEPNSHDGKALLHILESHPRDELFQATDDELFEIALGILHLQERQRVALFLRKDPFERFVSCLIYVPRDRFTTELRLRMQDIVAKAFNGRISAFYTQMTDAALSRLQLIVATTPGSVPDVDTGELEAKLVEAGRSWADSLQEALVDARGEEQGLLLLRRYANAFSTGYRERFDAHGAVLDIGLIEKALESGRLTMSLYRPVEAPPSELRFKIYNAGDQIPLSDVLPMLEHMGLKVISEAPHLVRPLDRPRPVWIHDFLMCTADGHDIDIGAVKDNFQKAFERAWRGKAEDDGFNRLVLLAGLTWRDVVILRAYCKYLRQIQVAFSQSYMEETLARNAGIAALLVKLFRTLFDPSHRAEADARADAIKAEIERALDQVANLDEDRILRRFLNLILATQRTNHYQTLGDGESKTYVSFKLDSRLIEELPLPRPLYEIWVYGPRVEAVHLRGGKVARGGIRWSDRREDFRTEVLGLMKAQMVKNAVIVPVGSKGGFVVKKPPAGGSRDQLLAEVIECYKTMMRGLLDLTDNLTANGLVPPPNLVRRDPDDPYLVVAADKGTATFSDIANSVSLEYGFWLGDAFASGGSVGYDHKKMAITARGAWESVKRHFRETGVDVQSTDFSVIGIGDMSGDVFGNGMLQSQHISLIGAFNHLHIFVDPAPDAAKSFAERKRLFDLPRSSWIDYDASLISEGGGVFDRKAKRIAVTPQMKAAFGLTADSISPNDLIRAMLKTPIDLLWLGGIGTYVKAASESHADVGDRTNDPLRVDAEELRCKVVGEGANLGFTQRGRVAYALKGGRLNTDAVDNSAGVDCSDHEVNIKILLNASVAAGDLTLKQRDKLLAQMTDEVGGLVLRDNYLQTQALTLAETQGWFRLDQQGRFMRALERAGKLDRAIEFLPDDETLATRLAQRHGLTRPELAVLMAYAKMSLYDELLPSDLPDDPQLIDDLRRYFPKLLQERFPDQIAQHQLRREIIATVVTNSLVNRAGLTFIHVMKEKTGQAASDIARAYAVTRAVFELRALWAEIEALDNKVPAKFQALMADATVRLAEAGTLWFLRNGKLPLDIAAHIEAHRSDIAKLGAQLEDYLTETDRAAFAKRVEALTLEGVPDPLARKVARLDLLAPGLDIVRIAQRSGKSLERVARTFYAVGVRFHLNWLRSATGGVNLDTHWDRMAVAAVLDDLYSHQRVLTERMLSANGVADGAPEAETIEQWAQARGSAVQRIEMLFADLRQQGGLDLAKLAVANRELRSLLGG
ncbi:NAD-glutamate dehydrogenase [Hypericibacter sp.]|uniref:NAD-glutamate dehydrogenase n=1 Tax=Hypericibacter sp. TaxID=2705401 RepID=UPI003D6D2824